MLLPLPLPKGEDEDEGFLFKGAHSTMGDRIFRLLTLALIVRGGEVTVSAGSGA